jgi:hypothetical protein
MSTETITTAAAETRGKARGMGMDAQVLSAPKTHQCHFLLRKKQCFQLCYTQVHFLITWKFCFILIFKKSLGLLYIIIISNSSSSAWDEIQDLMHAVQVLFHPAS